MVLPAEPLIRVLVVDGQPVVRAGFRAGLAPYKDICLQSEAADGASALETLRESAPDIAIIELSLPDIDGIELASRMHAREPDVRMMLISAAIDRATIERGLAAGILGFATKSSPLARLAEMIRQVYAVKFSCSTEWRPLAGSELPERADTVSAMSGLSPKEREIFVHLAEGASLKEAAKLMRLSYKSADHLKQSLMRKLDIHDRVELAKFAIR